MHPIFHTAKNEEVFKTIQEFVRKFGHRKVSIQTIRWVLKAFAEYLGLALAHGYDFRINHIIKLHPAFFLSPDRMYLRRTKMFCESLVRHDLFMRIYASYDKKYSRNDLIFTPAKEVRKIINEKLSDPDHVYKLTTE